MTKANRPVPSVPAGQLQKQASFDLVALPFKLMYEKNKRVYILKTDTRCDPLDALHECEKVDIASYNWIRTRFEIWLKNERQFYDFAHMKLDLTNSSIKRSFKLSTKRDVRVLGVQIDQAGSSYLIIMYVGRNHSAGDKKFGAKAPQKRMYNQIESIVNRQDFVAFSAQIGVNYPC